MYELADNPRSEDARKHIAEAEAAENRHRELEAQIADLERQLVATKAESDRQRMAGEDHRKAAFEAEKRFHENEDFERSFAEREEWLASLTPEQREAFKTAAREEMAKLDKARDQKEARRRSREV